MKPLLRTFSLIPLLAIGACAPSTSAPAGTGGATGSGGASTGSGGATTGTGGATTGTGGATGSGGAATGTGGATGSGGAATGTGGVAPGTGGAAGGATGTGGRGGATGTGGAVGTGGAGGGGAVTIASVAGIANANGAKLMDSFIMFPCLGTPATQDCVTANVCPNQNTALPFESQGLITNEVFQIGGTPGAMYNLTIRVNGIAEAKYYMGGTRFAGNATLANSDPIGGVDTFYTGGAPVNVENYNVYKFIVKNAAGTELQHYYLNSFPQVATPYENHQTFPIAFTHDIPVVGGGTFTFFTSDRNCRAIDNCGIGFRATPCAITDGRPIPNEPNVVIPTMYMGQTVASMNQRNGAAQPFHSQIFHIVVMAVTPM